MLTALIKSSISQLSQCKSSSLHKCFQQCSNPEKSVVLIKSTVGFHLVCEHHCLSHQSWRLLNSEENSSHDSLETFCFVMIERHQVAEITYCALKDHKPKLWWREVWILLSISSANILNHSAHSSKPASEMKCKLFVLWWETFLISLRDVKSTQLMLQR